MKNMNKFISYLQLAKPLIDKHTKAILLNYRKKFSQSGSFSKDTIDKLIKFSASGKNVRGSLFLFAAKALGLKNNPITIDLASAIELLHSSLLILDDIMDNDLKRRGQPSLYAQYLPLAAQNKIRDNLSFAKSMAMCTGNLGFFLAIHTVVNNGLEAKTKHLILDKISTEITAVHLSQMDDVYFAKAKHNPSKEQILNLYKHKTARYTFSLPLSLGAIAAGAKTEIIKKLEKLGEYIGLIYQLKDDELGLFSKVSTLGKPIGSDIRENKKTLIRFFLYQKADKKQKSLLNKIYASEDVTLSEIEKIRSLTDKLQVDIEIAELKNKYTANALKIVNNLSVKQKERVFIYDLIKYVNQRDR